MKKLIAATLLLTGCQMTPPTDNDYTTTPLPFEEIKQVILQEERYNFFDPESIIIDHVKTVNLQCREMDANGFTATHNLHTVYIVRINAKNRLGGYTGWQTHKYTYSNNILVEQKSYCGPLNK